MEIHTHGSLAVINKLLDEIGKIENCEICKARGVFQESIFK